MTQKLINVGIADKGNGDKLRDAFIKINDNFTDLYSVDSATQYYLGDEEIFISLDPEAGEIIIQSKYDSGMPIYIKGANCADGGVGGNVIIEAGGAPLPNTGTTGNIELAAQQTTIESNNNIWTFRDDGVLELPAGGDIVDSDGNTVLGGTGGSSDRLVNGDHEFVLNVNGVGPWISFPESSGSKIEIQGTDINGLGPFGLLLQSTENDVILSANATATNGPRRDWTFGTDGKLTTPDFWRVGNGNTSISNDGFANSSDLWLRAGDALFITTDLTVNGEASDSLWLFSNKILQLPNGGDIVDSNGNSVLGGGGGVSSYDQLTDKPIIKGGSGEVGVEDGTFFVIGKPNAQTGIVMFSDIEHGAPYERSIISKGTISHFRIGKNEGGTLEVFADGGDIQINAGSTSGRYAAIQGYNVEINTAYLSGTPKNFLFTYDGKLTLPVGGDIVDSTGTSVLGTTSVIDGGDATTWATP